MHAVHIIGTTADDNPKRTTVLIHINSSSSSNMVNGTAQTAQTVKSSPTLSAAYNTVQSVPNSSLPSFAGQPMQQQSQSQKFVSPNFPTASSNRTTSYTTSNMAASSTPGLTSSYQQQQQQLQPTTTTYHQQYQQPQPTTTTTYQQQLPTTVVTHMPSASQQLIGGSSVTSRPSRAYATTSQATTYSQMPHTTISPLTAYSTTQSMSGVVPQIVTESGIQAGINSGRLYAPANCSYVPGYLVARCGMPTLYDSNLVPTFESNLSFSGSAPATTANPMAGAQMATREVTAKSQMMLTRPQRSNCC